MWCSCLRHCVVHAHMSDLAESDEIAVNLSMDGEVRKQMEDERFAGGVVWGAAC